MIVFSVGTHEAPFDRLVRAAEILARQVDEPVFVQGGPSTVPTPSCERVDFVGPDVLLARFARARVVVMHAGPSTLVEAVDAGAIPVVVPRDPARGEHVDDHQLRWSATLDGIAVYRDPDRAVRDLVAGRVGVRAPGGGGSSAEATAAFCRRLDAQLRAIRAARVGGRGRRRAILSFVFRHLSPDA